MSYFELNAQLRAEIRPIIIQFIKVYNYSDLQDFSHAHREELYAHLLGCKSIDMNLVNDLICMDEFVQGICLGYIKAEEAKRDLLERLDDLLFKPLDHWVQFEAQREAETRERPKGEELHDILWASEARGRASDHNSTYFSQLAYDHE